jgi:hypothetical protein
MCSYLFLLILYFVFFTFEHIYGIYYYFSLPTITYSDCITSSGVLLCDFPDTGKGHPNVRGPKKEWIMNPNGKSYVCILHEYVQHALKKQPSYEFKELGNAWV